MDRRTFLRAAAAAGTCVVAPLGLAHGDEGSGELYEGPLFVTIQARGGWDPTYLCDPKGNALNATYGEGDILTARGIPYAPVGHNQTFFERYASELLVINGVDMSTNNHETGTRYAWTGAIADAGYPSFSGLCAGALSSKTPLSFLSFGGYDPAGNLVPRSRFPRLNNIESVLGRIQEPELLRYNGKKEGYHHADVQARITEALQARRARHEASHHLPREERARGVLFASSMSTSQLKALSLEDLHEDQTLRQADLAVAAFKAGLSVSANLGLGGFDTHDAMDDGQDVKQINQLTKLMKLVDYLLTRAEDAQIRDRLTLLITSDFSRTPRYNENLGKDHWSIGSAMLLGPGIAGGRVVGATTEEQKVMTFDPVTLAHSEEGSAARIRPEHIHKALREHAKISDHPACAQFPVEAQGFETILTA